MKKLIKFTAAALACGMAATLAGCAGCSGSAKNTAVTNSNWYTGTSYKGIQPSFVVSDEKYADYAEKIEYSVSFKKGENASYSVDYKEGTFSTEFYATEFDWNRENMPQGYKDENTDTELVYYYKTELKIKVRYSLADGKTASDWFDDSVINESYFRAAGKNLQPVYSKQTVKSTSPANFQASTLENAYRKVDAVYENFYNYECSEVTSLIAENGENSTQKHGLGKLDYSLFDNSSLYIAVRSMKLSENLANRVSLYSAAAGGVSAYNVTGTTTALGGDERLAISRALEDKGLYKFVTEDDKGNAVEDPGVKSVAVNISYAGGSLQGTTQTVWYAAIENSDNNTSRATMLKLSIPLSFGLGTLEMTLSEVKSTLWNK